MFSLQEDLVKKYQESAWTPLVPFLLLR
jgi:hypothetical protein